MKRNAIVRSMLEILGDKTNIGYSFNEVPILLNKDLTTTYPEIRVSPFISNRNTNYEKYIDVDTYRKYRDWEEGIFQVDIYSHSIIEAHHIFDALKKRIYDFFNLETLIYNWNNEFELINENTYRNKAYAVSHDKDYLFKDIYSITINDFNISRVCRKKDLDRDTFYVDEDYLYINTDKNLLDIEIKVLLQGRLFHDGGSHSDHGIHYCEVMSEKNLSGLEDNEVERISFDLFILYSHKREREKLPTVNRIKYPTKNHVR